MRDSRAPLELLQLAILECFFSLSLTLLLLLLLFLVFN